eukprot:GILK01006123.1.p1 GENE.GILK01006123.1~~GILK01006123.1.p1  ORF type:complete len:342 (+),score=37.32 GILK01006123.1:16-1041(+)
MEVRSVTNCLQEFIDQCENDAFKEQCEQEFKDFREQLEQSTQQTLENERKILQERRQALDDEIASMQKLPARQNDVVSVNCGGKKLMVKRSTLCTVEGSVLASMFSGRWEDSLEKDVKGNVFFDFNPDCFERIVNHIRLRLIEDPAKASPAPEIPSHLRTEFHALVQYLGLEAIFAAKPSSSLRFQQNGFFALTEDGTTVTNDGGARESAQAISFVEGMPATDVMEFSVRVLKIAGGPVGVGFMSEKSTANPYHPGYDKYTARAWFYHSGHIKLDGRDSHTGTSYAVGDVVKCSFVASTRLLSFSVNDSCVYSKNVNCGHGKIFKYPCVKLSDYGDSVKLV